MYSPSHNYISVLTDEIALEGLDGITLEALWTRLKERPGFTCVLDDASKAYFWKIIRSLRDVNMYELPKPRPPLVIFNRYNYVDPELGIVLEPSNIPEDIYPHCPIESKKTKVRGSCSTYYQRKNITRLVRTLSYEEVMEKWNSKLVVVAKQDARNIALMGVNSNPHLELTINQYCVLERIGRSRYLGEVTQGKVSLQVVVDDPKTLFYHRKFLMKHKLVVKQVHHQKAGFQNCTGSLMHLPRFHVERKPKALYLTEKVIEILKSRPNNLAEYEEIRKELGLANSLKKLFKTMEFQRYVKTDLRLPYRELYPSASISEWKHKGSDREKKIRVIQLINPDMDIRDIWTKDDDVEDEDEAPAGLLDQKDLLLDRSILSQAFAVVENAGPEGLSQMQLSTKMGVSKLQSRTLCRNLMRKGVVSPFMNDVGRQRVFRYMSKKYAKEGKMSVQFMREKKKMLELVGKRKAKKKKSKSANETEGDAAQSEFKRPLEEGDPSAGPEAKKLKTEAVGNHNIEQEQSDPAQGSSELATTSIEQNIETRVLEEMMVIPGVKDYQVSFTEELLKTKNSTKETPSPNITYRILRRANIIIEAVRAHKVIDDLTKLMKHIKEEEDKEGYNVKIDKKSLLRLLVKLSKDGHIKVIKIVLKGGTKEKLLTFVCEPDITTDHTIIQSAVEQAKMKFFILGREKIGKLCNDKDKEKKEKEKEDDTFSAKSISMSMEELKSISSKDTKLMSEFVYDSRIGKKYGFSPKFVRMKVLHRFLFYLLYCYTGREDLDQEAVIKHIREGENSLTDEIMSEMSQIYLDEVSWKMFIPPLPKHAGWPEGWTIMCDLLLRLPLYVFVRIFNVSFVIPDLEQYLAHPIRRNYLVRHLPTHLRNALMVARRYIFSIHEVMQRLCFVGLIQFGPQRLKEKDQVFVYLNRRTSLLDTTTSRPSYHQVSDDIKYTEHKYKFNDLNDVDKYWYEMWNFCIHTQLGGRMHVTGKDIVLEVLQNKQVMIDAIQPRQPLEAPLLDTGEVPGDKRGAAGLDSALFSHLKRNWHWTNTNISVASTNSVPAVKPKIMEQRKARLASLKPEPLNLGEIFQKHPKKIAKNPNSIVKKRASNRKSEAKKTIVKATPRVSKAKNVVRHVLPRKMKKIHRPYYDDVDMKALQLMSKLRVEWSTTEDNLLLLCKVAGMYLCPNPRKQIITVQMIRDIIHEICPSSSNKTSRACQRRIIYMMKNPATSHSVALHLEDVRQDPRIVEQFKDTVQELNAKTDNPEKLEKLAGEKLKLLVYTLQQKFNPEPVEHHVLHKVLPETMSEFRKQYDLVYPASTLKKKGHFQDIKNVVDIHCAVVNAIIHSSLCCVSDKTSYTYQLFQVYQQYPDNLLRSAMAKIRGDQMVSLKKSYIRLKQKTGNYLPVSSSPYQLSISYVYQLQTKYQYDIFYECYQMCKSLCAWYCAPTPLGMEAVMSNGGMAAALVELFTRKQITFDIEIPEQVIILDPRVSEKDETYARIVQRYRDILRSYKAGKEMATSSVLFKKPFLDLDGQKDNVIPSGSRDVDDEPDYTEVEVESGDKAANSNQQHAIARAASRIALYMMREELGDAMMGGEKQHAHDFFVVNSCRVSYKLLDPGSKTVEGRVDGQSNKNNIDIGSRHDPINARNERIVEEELVMREDSPMEVDTPISIGNKVSQNKSMEFVEPPKNVKSMDVIEQSQNCEPMEVEQSEDQKYMENAEKSQNCQSMEIEESENDHKLSFKQSENVQSLESVGQYEEMLPKAVELEIGVPSGSNVSREDLDSEKNKIESPKRSSTVSEASDKKKEQSMASEPDVKVPQNISDKLLPLTAEQIKKILGEIMSSTYVSDVPVEVDDVCKFFHESGGCDADWMKALEILEFVKKKKEIGATMKELRHIFRKSKCVMSLATMLEVLTKTRVLYRTGVTTVHYVYQLFIKPWLVHSYKLLRLEREKIIPAAEHAVVNMVEDDPADKSSEKTHERIRAWRRRKLITAAKQVEKAVQTLDLSQTEKIHIAIRPWVRVDGSVNRRVLDRLLGAVLGHSLYTPGGTLKEIGDRFCPALQPFQVRELVEILQKLGCVKLSVVRQSCKTTLLSKPSTVKIEPADGTEDENKISVDPQPDAVIRLGQFIGDKAYSRDFLSMNVE